MSSLPEYPRFRFLETRGIIPDVPLPLDYRSLVPAFYAAGGRERIEQYARSLGQNTSGSFDTYEPRLRWDDERGLTNISVTPSTGLDLNKQDEFQEHNLGGRTSLVTGAIAIEYIALLVNPHTR